MFVSQGEKAYEKENTKLGGCLYVIVSISGDIINYAFI